MENALLSFAVAAVVEFVKRLFSKDYQASVIIAGAAVVGALLAPYAGDYTWFQGMIMGLQASGLITTLTYIK